MERSRLHTPPPSNPLPAGACALRVSSRRDSGCASAAERALASARAPTSSASTRQPCSATTNPASAALPSRPRIRPGFRPKSKKSKATSRLAPRRASGDLDSCRSSAAAEAALPPPPPPAPRCAAATPGRPGAWKKPKGSSSSSSSPPSSSSSSKKSVASSNRSSSSNSAEALSLTKPPAPGPAEPPAPPQVGRSWLSPWARRRALSGSTTRASNLRGAWGTSHPNPSHSPGASTQRTPLAARAPNRRSPNPAEAAWPVVPGSGACRNSTQCRERLRIDTAGAATCTLPPPLARGLGLALVPPGRQTSTLARESFCSAASCTSTWHTTSRCESTTEPVPLTNAPSKTPPDEAPDGAAEGGGSQTGVPPTAPIATPPSAHPELFLNLTRSCLGLAWSAQWKKALLPAATSTT
mmetsp:Transcript_32705/g.73824  ORF Transcript_32705/g.73824 Transcript_32705/m.73824 type:complete len:411 (+) Transcript_32705:537-1769(+)